MGRVWLGATHSSRPPEAAALGSRTLVPPPAQQHHQQDGPHAGQQDAMSDERRPRWLRWLVRA